jgi:ketosteroid isomerase-like protein
MRFLIMSSMLLAALSAPADDGGDEAELRHLKEVTWPQAYRERDVALLDRLLDPEFVLVSEDGSWSTKADELAALPGSTWAHDSFRFVIRRLDLYHDNTAIVSGEGRATGTDENGPYCLRYQSSNVLVRRDTGWRAVLSHVSGVETRCVATTDPARPTD